MQNCDEDNKKDWCMWKFDEVRKKIEVPWFQKKFFELVTVWESRSKYMKVKVEFEFGDRGVWIENLGIVVWRRKINRKKRIVGLGVAVWEENWYLKINKIKIFENDTCRSQNPWVTSAI